MSTYRKNILTVVFIHPIHQLRGRNNKVDRVVLSRRWPTLEITRTSERDFPKFAFSGFMGGVSGLEMKDKGSKANY